MQFTSTPWPLTTSLCMGGVALAIIVCVVFLFTGMSVSFTSASTRTQNIIGVVFLIAIIVAIVMVIASFFVR